MPLPKAPFTLQKPGFLELTYRKTGEDEYTIRVDNGLSKPYEFTLNNSQSERAVQYSLSNGWAIKES